MLHPLTIKFPLNFFNPEKFGLTIALADSDPDLFANNVAGSLGEIFRKIGQNARIAVTTSEVTVTTELPSAIVSGHNSRMSSSYKLPTLSDIEPCHCVRNMYSYF